MKQARRKAVSGSVMGLMLVVLLTACSSPAPVATDDSASDSVSSQEAATDESSAESEADGGGYQAFADHLASRGIVVGSDVSDVGQFADEVCRGLGNKVSPDALAQALVGGSIDAIAAATVVTYAVHDVCPEYEDQLP